VPYSDRAFRALVREQPEVLLALLEATLPPQPWLDGPVTPENVDDSHLDLPPTIDADSVARSGSVVLHTECQGYRDATFSDRVFRYHLLLTLRYPAFRVETIALWLARPSPAQRDGVIVRGNLTLRVHVVVLREIRAEVLLSDPRTACFAPGADSTTLSEQELCAAAARMLRDHATGRELHMAVVAAAIRGRYSLMIKAMEAAKIQPVVIEDLVEIGRDMGLAEGVEKGRAEGVEKGRAEGVEKGRAEGIEAARDMLFDAIAARGFALGAAERERIAAERSLSRLREWHRVALVAQSLDAFFED
jgi:predicted transposase YdaD